MAQTDDLEEIRQLKARYFRLMDEKDWDALADVFTDDVEMDMRGEGSELIRGRDAYMPFIRQVLDGVTTVHHGHMPEIELTSATTATGIWAMEDKLWWTNGEHEEHLHGYGHYHEEYRRENGRWLISYRKLTRLRADVTAGFFDYIQTL